MQEGIGVHMSGDIAAIQAHQQKVIQWRLDNVSYFAGQSGGAIETMRSMQVFQANQENHENQTVLDGRAVEENHVTVVSVKNHMNGVEINFSDGNSALQVHHFDVPQWQPYNVSYFRSKMQKDKREN